MKKAVISLITLILVLIIGTSQAVSYTLPEKMYNQLAIGSGLKGSFVIAAEGEEFRTPFLEAVSDAEWSIRGIASGKDYHYYIFQADDNEQQTAVNELYRKENVFYFRSDMVQGKVLAFPTLGQYLDAVFPTSGENGSSSSFVSRIITLSEDEKKENWDPVLTRYQNDLEMWLAEFTVNADTIKMENGFSALDFTYEIPRDRLTEKIISLVEQVASDPEASALLDTVMSPEEKSVYLNPNLMYFYQEALKTLVLDQPVKMNKRVSAMGDLLRFRLELPLDERTTGYRSLDIETIDQLTVYTLQKSGEIILVGIPSADVFKQEEYEQSIWFARITDDETAKGFLNNIAIRADIKKTHNVYEEDEKTHETEHYSVTIANDISRLPENADLSGLTAEFELMAIEADLHYSSKYAQNSATTLEAQVDIKQGESQMSIQAKMKTAAPWLFMPFEVIDPIQIGTDADQVFYPYLTDWISNAASIIRHNGTTEESSDNQTVNNDGETSTETMLEEQNGEEDHNNPDAEAQPLEDSGQE